MSEQFQAALRRALIIAVISAASTALSTWATTNDAKIIFIAAATAFLAPFIARFGGEGAYDTQRDKRGNVQPSDVGAHVPITQAR